MLEEQLENIRNLFDKIDAKKGIGNNLFLSISQLTPMVNVDLVVKSKDKKRTLLSWRDDLYYGPGWHIPGSIVRFKETMKKTLSRIEDFELNFKVSNLRGPIGFHEMFNHKRNIRGHFISFIFTGIPTTDPNVVDIESNQLKNGDLCWFEKCPKNLIKNQFQLKKYIEETTL